MLTRIIERWGYKKPLPVFDMHGKFTGYSLPTIKCGKRGANQWHGWKTRAGRELWPQWGHPGHHMVLRPLGYGLKKKKNK